MPASRRNIRFTVSFHPIAHGYQEQQAIADVILKGKNKEESNIHFCQWHLVDARYGRGKTFLINYLAPVMLLEADQPKIVLSKTKRGFKLLNLQTRF